MSTTKKAVITINVGNKPNVVKMFQMSRPYMEKYAEKCEADFIVIDDNWRKDEHPCYLKQCINYYFDVDKYDQILYMDSDMLVKPDTPNLFEMVPNDKLGVYGDINRQKQITEMYAYVSKYNELMLKYGERPIFFHEWNQTFYNAGLFICSKYTNPHIPPICNVMRLDGTIYYDQLYFNLMIYKHRIPVFELSHKYNRLRTVDRKIGSTDRLKDSYIIHYAGPRGKEEMSVDYNRLKRMYG